MLNWVFKDINFTFEHLGVYAILGANGSGKSTLMRIIAGMQNHSSGKIHYEINGVIIESDKIFDYISYCAPAMDIIEEMTLKEFLTFHFSFKKIIPGYSIDQIIEEMNLGKFKHQLIMEYSSGMKQRVKLAQAFFTDAPILFLDEPTSNLDLDGVNLYLTWLQKFGHNRITIVGSNDDREYPNPIGTIVMNDYK